MESSTADLTIFNLIAAFSGPLSADEAGKTLLEWARRLTDAADAEFLPPVRPHPDQAAEASMHSGQVIAYPASHASGAALYATLFSEGAPAAVVRVSRAQSDGPFDATDEALLEAVARLGGQALEIARLRAAQRQLLERARLSTLGELSAIIAHQIKNPLTTILGDAELLTESLPPGEAADSARAILRAGQRAQEVVQRVLGQAHPAPEPHAVDVNRTLEEAVALVGDALTQGAALTLNLGAGLPPVQAVGAQLIDVWLNLLSNSRDAIQARSGAPGAIRVSSTGSDGTGVVVTVQDDGPGIPASNLPRVFDPFFTTKPLGEGTGLGLYVCQRIVAGLGGTIELTSTAGRGTSVRVWLPAASAERAAQ